MFFRKYFLIWHYNGKFRAGCIPADRNVSRIYGWRTHCTPRDSCNKHSVNAKVLAELLITVIVSLTHGQLFHIRVMLYSIVTLVGKHYSVYSDVMLNQVRKQMFQKDFLFKRSLRDVETHTFLCCFIKMYMLFFYFFN